MSYKDILVTLFISFSISSFLISQCDDSDNTVYTTDLDIITPDYDPGAYSNGDQILLDFTFDLTNTTNFATSDIDKVVFSYTLGGLGFTGGGYLSSPGFSQSITYDGGNFNDANAATSDDWCIGKTLAIDGFVLLNDGRQIPFSVGPISAWGSGNTPFTVS